MEYFFVILLALAGNVKVSDANCKPLVTTDRDFEIICNDVNPELFITLPHPESKNKFVECVKDGHQITQNSDFSSTCLDNTCYDIVKNVCENPSDESKCVDPAEICAEGDSLVPYAAKNNFFYSKYFADCINGPKNFEVGLCYSDDEDEACVFDPKKKKCVTLY